MTQTHTIKIELYHDEYENVERMIVNGTDVPVDLDYIKTLIDGGDIDATLDITNYYA